MKKQEIPIDPSVAFVTVDVSFTDDGRFQPLSFSYNGQEYEIQKILEAAPSEEAETLFSPPSRVIVYRYRVKLKGGKEASLYFRRWEEGKGMLGRWFVVKKGT